MHKYKKIFEDQVTKDLQEFRKDNSVIFEDQELKHETLNECSARTKMFVKLLTRCQNQNDIIASIHSLIKLFMEIDKNGQKRI